MTAADIPWKLTPIDPLLLSDHDRLVANVFFVASCQMAEQRVRLDRLTARNGELLRELRAANDELRTLRAQVRAAGEAAA
jgi:hypothetical protein